MSTLRHSNSVRYLKYARIGAAAVWKSLCPVLAHLIKGFHWPQLYKDTDYGQWCSTVCLRVSKVDVCQRNNVSLFSVEQLRNLTERRRFWWLATDAVEQAAQRAGAQTRTRRCYVLRSQMLILFHYWSLGNSCVKHCGGRRGQVFPWATSIMKFLLSIPGSITQGQLISSCQWCSAYHHEERWSLVDCWLQLSNDSCFAISQQKVLNSHCSRSQTLR